MAAFIALSSLAASRFPPLWESLFYCCKVGIVYLILFYLGPITSLGSFGPEYLNHLHLGSKVPLALYLFLLGVSNSLWGACSSTLASRLLLLVLLFDYVNGCAQISPALHEFLVRRSQFWWQLLGAFVREFTLGKLVACYCSMVGFLL